MGRAEYFRQLTRLRVDAVLDRYARLDADKALLLFKTRLDEACSLAAMNGCTSGVVEWNPGEKVAHERVLNEYLEAQGFGYSWDKWEPRWNCFVKWGLNEK